MDEEERGGEQEGKAGRDEGIRAGGGQGEKGS